MSSNRTMRTRSMSSNRTMRNQTNQSPPNSNQSPPNSTSSTNVNQSTNSNRFILTNENKSQAIKKYFNEQPFEDDINGRIDNLKTQFPIGEWDTSRVTDMKNLFGYIFSSSSRESFNENINNWDVSNVTNMSEMFLV